MHASFLSLSLDVFLLIFASYCMKCVAFVCPNYEQDKTDVIWTDSWRGLYLPGTTLTMGIFISLIQYLNQ